MAQGTELDPAEWGKAILEDILFRAARDVSARADDDAVTVALTFRVRADKAAGTLEISTPGAVEPVITLRLPLDLI